MAARNLVLRTMYIDPDVDEELRTEAFDSRTSKNDLVRRYLRLGMETARKEATPARSVSARVVAREAAVTESGIDNAGKRKAIAPAIKKATPRAVATLSKAVAKT